MLKDKENRLLMLMVEIFSRTNSEILMPSTTRRSQLCQLQLSDPSYANCNSAILLYQVQQGDYRWVAEVVNHVVFANPTNQATRDLQADALEQLGYQAESGPLRNFYLSGAKELREGVQKAGTPNTASPDTIRAMSLDLIFDYLGIRLNGPKAVDAQIILNWDFTDTNQQYIVGVENSTLNAISGQQSPNADSTIKLTRVALNEVLLDPSQLQNKIEAGDIVIVGNQMKLNELLSLLDSFDFWFNIVTPNEMNHS